MGARSRLLASVRNVLAEKLFSDHQIEKIIPRLDERYLEKPAYLSEIVDTWNELMSNREVTSQDFTMALATPPKNSPLSRRDVNINTILGDIEPDLLLLEPSKLIRRHTRLQKLNIAHNLGENWMLLFNAPRGFYLQDWTELMKKIYYIEQNVVNLLYDKKEQKSMDVHPLVKSASAVELDFDHIRTRYLFALRSGYTALSHMYKIQTALDRPGLKNILCSDDRSYLEEFTPFCTLEEYSAFSDLIKNQEIEVDDAEVIEKLAELDSLKH
mgnify:CR=1 FL=1